MDPRYQRVEIVEATATQWRLPQTGRFVEGSDSNCVYPRSKIDGPDKKITVTDSKQFKWKQEHKQDGAMPTQAWKFIYLRKHGV